MRCALPAILGLLALAVAATAPSATIAQSGTALTVELNKLETIDKGCRAYVVVDNPTAADYEILKLDLFMFRTDGVIGRRFVVDIAPMKSMKRSVKLFDLAGLVCDEVGSFLLNDVTECRAGGAAVPDCLARLSPSSRATAKLIK